MKIVLVAAAVLALLPTGHTVAAERYHSSTLKFIYPLGNGDFVLGFDADSAQCTAAGSPKYMYVAVGQNGVNEEGAKKLYSASMLAYSMRSPVYVAFDDTTTFCYVNRLHVSY